MNSKDLQAYHTHISDTYDARSANHEKSQWHRKTALKLIDEMPPNSGDSVLDIGTGTGTIAFHAASLVGPTGRVMGIDLSTGMLEQAHRRLTNTEFKNLEFVLADAERLTFSDNSFDRIYCASAFFCILDPLATLRKWLASLKPGGILGFHAQPETSYFWVREARKIFTRHGYPYLINDATATIEKSERLLRDAGFVAVDIRVEKSGYYMSAEQARDSWIKESDFFPGQYPHPVTNVPPDVLLQWKLEYESNIEDLITEKGIWNDISMYYIYAYKQKIA
jgi:ubiquinone/menaquinone biosynthesis C-methylase UbiE